MNGFTLRLLIAGLLSASTFVGALALGVSTQTGGVDQRQAARLELSDGGSVLR